MQCLFFVMTTHVAWKAFPRFRAMVYLITNCCRQLRIWPYRVGCRWLTCQNSFRKMRVQSEGGKLRAETSTSCRSSTVINVRRRAPCPSLLARACACACACACKCACACACKCACKCACGVRVRASVLCSFRQTTICGHHQTSILEKPRMYAGLQVTHLSKEEQRGCDTPRDARGLVGLLGTSASPSSWVLVRAAD